MNAFRKIHFFFSQINFSHFSLERQILTFRTTLSGMRTVEIHFCHYLVNKISNQMRTEATFLFKEDIPGLLFVYFCHIVLEATTALNSEIFCGFCSRLWSYVNDLRTTWRLGFIANILEKNSLPRA